MSIFLDVVLSIRASNKKERRKRLVKDLTLMSKVVCIEVNNVPFCVALKNFDDAFILWALYHEHDFFIILSGHVCILTLFHNCYEGSVEILLFEGKMHHKWFSDLNIRSNFSNIKTLHLIVETISTLSSQSELYFSFKEIMPWWIDV